MADLELLVNGSSYSGWSSVKVVRSLEQLADTFEVGVTDHWSDDGLPVPIAEGDAVQVKVDGEKLITGYVDDVKAQYDAQSRSLSISGRSKTGDLVDCSVLRKGGQWRKRTLKQIADDVCQPFGISVTLSREVALGGVDVNSPFRAFAVEEGETAHDLLERAARVRGVLLVSDGDGNLVVARAAGAPIRTALVTGENILSGSREGSWKERFSQYIVKGQTTGDDQNFGDAVTRKAETSDARVSRYRPIVIMAEAPGEDLKDRAAWEKNVRYGKSLRITETVQGWKHEDGLWAPNLRVRVTDRILGVDADLIIVGVTLSLDENGETAELQLLRPEAYSEHELPPPSVQKDEWWKGLKTAPGGGR
jgi:prophage tail gpP-like protein